MLFVGDDWAEDHHDVEILDRDGKRLGRARLPEGMAGMTRLHEMISEHLDDAVDPDTGMLAPGRVVVGIETDRGPWVAALIAAGYQVFAINPMSAARYRERHTTSGAKSDRVMPTCSPRSSVWTAPITARSPATRRRSRA